MAKEEKSYTYNKSMSVPYIEDYQDFATWEKVVKAWEILTPIPKAERGYSLAQSLPISSIRYGRSLREDVYKNCPPEDLVNDIKGVSKIISFLQKRFWTDPETAVYDTHARLKTISRKKDQSITDYIMEHDDLYTKAKQLKIVPSGPTFDMCQALDLMITANLSRHEFMIIKSQADVLNGDGGRYEVVKSKMREILGKNNQSYETAVDKSLSQTEFKREDDITKDDHVLLAKSSTKPPTNFKRYQNNHNRYQNNQKAKTDHQSKPILRLKPRNPKGADGNPLKCLCCKSITHLIRECPDAKTDITSEISDSESEQEEVFCSAAIAGRQKNDFLEESANKAILDTACSSNIMGEKWLKTYIKALPYDMKSKVQGPAKSRKLFMFGNQQKLESKGKYIIPITISGKEEKITVDLIKSDIPLILSRGEMKRLGVILNIKTDEALTDGGRLILETNSVGHYITNVLPLKLPNDTMFSTMKDHITRLKSSSIKLFFYLLRKIM